MTCPLHIHRVWGSWGVWLSFGGGCLSGPSRIQPFRISTGVAGEGTAKPENSNGNYATGDRTSVFALDASRTDVWSDEKKLNFANSDYHVLIDFSGGSRDGRSTKTRNLVCNCKHCVYVSCKSWSVFSSSHEAAIKHRATGNFWQSRGRHPSTTQIPIKDKIHVI